MALLFYFVSFILFLYAALAPVLDYVISGDFNVIAWGLAFFALGHVLHNYTPGYFGRFPGRGIR